MTRGAAAVVLLMAGCGSIPQPLKTYEGPALPAHAVAHIAGVPRDDQGGVFIVCIDGVSLERHWGAYDNNSRWPDQVAVAPGRHYLAVVYSLFRGKRAWWVNLELTAEAGHHYAIRSDAPQGDWIEMQAQDSATGKVVATAMPRRGRLKSVDPCP